MHHLRLSKFDVSQSFVRGSAVAALGAVLMAFLLYSAARACTGQNGGATVKSAPALRTAPVLWPEPSALAGTAVQSTEPTLVILVQFSDHPGRTTQANWNTKVFGAASSVRDYFQEVSYYNPTVTGLDLPPAPETSAPNNDGVVGWYTITYTDTSTGLSHTKHPENVYGDGWEWKSSPDISAAVAGAAVSAADLHVNFAFFDSDGDGFISAKELHIIVIVAGYEDSYSDNRSPDTWRHHWYLDTGVTVDGVAVLQHDHGGGFCILGELDPEKTMIEFGLICHEMGHDLGLPDLYDTSDPSKSEGIGDWGLMSSGDWCKVTDDADSPSHLCAWSKIKLGWISPTVVTVDQIGAQIPQIETNAKVFKLQSRGQPADDYFLVANRQRVGYDQALVRSAPASGLLIWHIDDGVDDNTNEKHKIVDLECADGDAGHKNDADGLDRKKNDGDATDPWYAGNDADFHTSSKPDNRDYRSPNNFNTAVQVRNISASGDPMTADLRVGRTTYVKDKWFNGKGQRANFTVPVGGRLRAYFHGWNCSGNVRVYEKYAAGNWIGVAGWPCTVPRFNRFAPGGEIREITAEYSGMFAMVAYGLSGKGCDQPTDAGYFVKVYSDPAPPGFFQMDSLYYAGWNVGFLDTSSAEFGDIDEPSWAFWPNQDDVSLQEFPSRAGSEGVESLSLYFEVSPNVFWDHMALQFHVASVYTPGVLTVTCPVAEYSDIDVPVTAPGSYEVDLGYIHTTGVTQITMTVPPATDFSWDWMDLCSQVPPLDLIEPEDGTTTGQDTPLFGWTGLVDADRYHLQLDDDFGSPAVDDSEVVATEYIPQAGIDDGIYHWRVRGHTAFGGWSNWTYDWSIGIDTEAPVFSGTTDWPDTSFLGPFSVATCVADEGAGLDTVQLCHRVDGGAWQGLSMVLAGDFHEADIPALDSSTTIDYYLVAKDLLGHESRDPAGAPGSVYTFVVEDLAGARPDRDPRLPPVFALLANQPNPFGSATEIRYALPVDCFVNLDIYDVRGRRVKTLVKGPQDAGFRSSTWDGYDQSDARVSSGIYFYRLEAGGFVKTRKMILLR